MSTEDSIEYRNEDLPLVVGDPIPDYEAGRRSITVRGGKTRRDMVKEKFEDPNVMEKMLATLRDSVGLVGDIFDTVRKKTVDGGSS